MQIKLLSEGQMVESVVPRLEVDGQQRALRVDPELLSLRYVLRVPYYALTSGPCPRPKFRCRYFPPPIVSPYTFWEALNLLVIFNQRWLTPGVVPRPELEPWAEEASRRRRRTASGRSGGGCRGSPGGASGPAQTGADLVVQGGQIEPQAEVPDESGLLECRWNIASDMELYAPKV